MPIIQGYSKKSIGKNIEEEETKGKKPHNQAVAIALDVARDAHEVEGGKGHLAKYLKKKKSQGEC